MKNDFEDDLDEVFGEAGMTKDQLMSARQKFFSALYALKITDTKCSLLCNTVFRMHKKPPPLKKLPPTDANAPFHFMRAHCQCLLWKFEDKAQPPVIDICNHGCGEQMSRR